MTTLAKDARPGKIYRLTRDPGSVYYKICDDRTLDRLEKRLGKLDVRSMRPEDLKTWKVVRACRSSGDILGIRVLRFQDDKGTKRETKAYVGFPKDYVLREVDKPPGYARSSAVRAALDSARESAENGEHQ